MAENIMVPPVGVQRACKRGLVMFEEGKGGDGLEPATIKEARSMARGEEQTEAKIRKGNRWWGRNARFLDEPDDSPAMVAALLWGGEPGMRWFKRAYESVIKEEKSLQMNFNTRQERQFELRMEGAEASNGGLKGMALKYGVLDSYRSVFAPGSATAALPDFVANGSFLESHDADDLAIGYIKSATDNGAGVEVEVEYHSTPAAKDARTVALERLAAGKKVGLSIGFTIGDYLEFENGEEMLRMVDTLGMDKMLFNVEAIRKCNRECYLIMRLAKIYEVSQVNFPAVPESEASEVRNSLKGAHAGSSFADQLSSVLDAVEGVTTRANEVLVLREAQDKTLGKSTLERLEAIRSNLDELLTRANEPTVQELQDLKFAQLEKLLK
jgi:phage head maturation protease